MVAVLQTRPLDTQSAISVGLMVTIIGAVAWLSRVLTRSEEQLKGINEKLVELKQIPERMTKMEGEVSHIKRHVESLEEDVNNLWTEWREDGVEGKDLLDRTRRERGPRPRRDG